MQLHFHKCPNQNVIFDNTFDNYKDDVCIDFRKFKTFDIAYDFYKKHS